MRFMNVVYLTCLYILFAPVFAMGESGHEHDHGHGHEDEEHVDEIERGQHGGNVLTKDDFSLEVTIFESGVPPQFRLYAFKDGKPISPQEIKANITLSRFARAKEEFQLVPEGDYLTSKKFVEEPHSFDLSITAQFGGSEYKWEYASHEGRTELSEEALKVAKLEVSTAGPHEISNTARVYGRLLPNEDKVAHVYPRFPGIIKQIGKSLGDQVARGEVLAIVESNQSLQSYEIRSQVEGVVIKRHATLGEFVPDSREIFVVADLSEVWADFQVYRDDFGEVTAGQKITVDLGEGTEIPATVTYISPITDEVTQSKLIRASLPNENAQLRPGLFVSGVLSSADMVVPLAVKREAIQTFRDWNVVYLTDGHVFQAVPVELGRKDSSYVEIVSGLIPGDRYVSRNSFIIKADIEKSGASHDH